jgi:hypothetical protein
LLKLQEALSAPVLINVSCTVAQVREKELELIRQTAVIKTLNLCLVFAVPPAIALVIFATYAYSVGKLTSSMAFVVLSLFNTLRFPLVVLPKALRGASGTAPGPACSRSEYTDEAEHINACRIALSTLLQLRKGHSMPLLQCCSHLRTIVAVPAEAIAAMKRIQAFLMLPETEEQQQASEPQAVIVSYSNSSRPVCNCSTCTEPAAVYCRTCGNIVLCWFASDHSCGHCSDCRKMLSCTSATRLSSH